MEGFHVMIIHSHEPVDKRLWFFQESRLAHFTDSLKHELEQGFSVLKFHIESLVISWTCLRLI